MTTVEMGEHVRFYRKNKNLTQEGLAFEAGISTKQLSDIELGKTNSSVVTMSKIANALGIQLELLIKEEKSIDFLKEAHDLSRFQPALEQLPEDTQNIIIAGLKGMISSCADNN